MAARRLFAKRKIGASIIPSTSTESQHDEDEFTTPSAPMKRKVKKNAAQIDSMYEFESQVIPTIIHDTSSSSSDDEENMSQQASTSAPEVRGLVVQAASTISSQLQAQPAIVDYPADCQSSQKLHGSPQMSLKSPPAKEIPLVQAPLQHLPAVAEPPAKFFKDWGYMFGGTNSIKVSYEQYFMLNTKITQLYVLEKKLSFFLVLGMVWGRFTCYPTFPYNFKLLFLLKKSSDFNCNILY